jgi:hypothetical protein
VSKRDFSAPSGGLVYQAMFKYLIPTCQGNIFGLLNIFFKPFAISTLSTHSEENCLVGRFK